MYRVLSFVLVFGFWVSGVCQDDKAVEILTKVDSVYAHLDLYSDSGKVEQRIKRKNRKDLRQDLIYETVFIRDSLFRFDYYEKGRFSSFYGFQWKASGKMISRTFSRTHRYTEQDIGLLVAASTGVSGGASHSIPRLLMPNSVTGRMITGKKESFEMVGNDAVEGFDCWILSRDSVEMLWIDKDSYLIRRIFEKGIASSTTSISPVANTSFTSDQLVYRPGKKAFWISLKSIPRALMRIEIIGIVALALFLEGIRRIRRRKGKVQ